MRDKYFYLLTFIFVFVSSFTFLFVTNITCKYNESCNNFCNISLVIADLPPLPVKFEPIAKRENEYAYYLKSCVRIKQSDASSIMNYGSGTICYFDPNANYAYVISCSHIFTGSERNLGNIELTVFYKNDIKLSSPETFTAEVVCQDKTQDISILRFKPTWAITHYFPIAPINYQLNPNDSYESIGCDNASDPAAYTVTIANISPELRSKYGNNIITINNSPRPGRSGGGIISPEGYYLGIVWGTTELDGSGYGFGVPLSRIHSFLSKQKEVSFLLGGYKPVPFLDSIPLIDRDGVLINAPRGFLPFPKLNQ